MLNEQRVLSIAAMQVIRRNGDVVTFQPDKIAIALTKAFLAVEGSQGSASSRIRDVVAQLTDTVVRSLTRRLPDGGTVHIENIQDQVELALMRSGEHDVARAYVLYRERRAAERAAQAGADSAPVLHVLVQGERRPLDTYFLRNVRAFQPGKKVQAYGVDVQAVFFRHARDVRVQQRTFFLGQS